MSYYSFEGVDIETLANPDSYSQRQIDFACLVAAACLSFFPSRGKLVICEPPEESPQ